jgi:hypothetical protein
MKIALAAASILLVSAFSLPAEAQRVRTGKVCGNPTMPCKVRAKFQSYELPFDTGRNYSIADSEPFYAVIIESRRLDPADDCEKVFTERRRLDLQRMFPNNKVFALKCFEPGLNYYTNVADDVGFIAVFAGRSAAESRDFFTTVKAKFPGSSLRRMQAGINGT